MEGINGKPPVEKGDILRDAMCEAIGEKGDGVFKHEGYIIFVKDTVQGNLYDVEVTRTLPKVGFGVKVEK